MSRWVSNAPPSAAVVYPKAAPTLACSASPFPSSTLSPYSLGVVALQYHIRHAPPFTASCRTPHACTAARRTIPAPSLPPLSGSLAAQHPAHLSASPLLGYARLALRSPAFWAASSPCAMPLSRPFDPTLPPPSGSLSTPRTAAHLFFGAMPALRCTHRGSGRLPRRARCRFSRPFTPDAPAAVPLAQHPAHRSASLLWGYARLALRSPAP
ncbi:hypothetical protein C8R47DRAFT_1216611 [Mycena vitilis]|nr:hypothetical protein C8R47DRAFT_1216611 [Mycena vitilis]